MCVCVCVCGRVRSFVREFSRRKAMKSGTRSKKTQPPARYLLRPAMGTPWRDRALSLAHSAAATSTTVATIARNDAWLFALATLHTSTLALVLAARDSQPLQLAVLGAGFAIVRGGGAINAALGDRWRVFASRDYFDPGGAFYAAAVAAPLLGIMCVQLVSL